MKKARIERSPSSRNAPFSCFRPRMPFSSAALLRTCPLRSFGTLDYLLWGRNFGIRSAHTHDGSEPARLRERIEHQDQEDRKGCRQKRARSAKQPRPEDKPDEEDCRREAEPPSHKHRRERVLCQNIYHYDPRDNQ